MRPESMTAAELINYMNYVSPSTALEKVLLGALTAALNLAELEGTFELALDDCQEEIIRLESKIGHLESQISAIKKIVNE
jgi:cell division protein FtsL